MIRLVTILSGVFMVACSAEVPSEQTKQATAPSVNMSHDIPEITPPADVTAMRIDPETVKKEIFASCEIKRGDKQPIPTTFKLVSTSPDGMNALYSDGGFLGGDHNVFDEISAIIKGNGDKAIIVTPSEAISITVKGNGIGFNFRDGKLLCSGISKT